MAGQVVGLRKAEAAVRETIALNDVQMDLERAKFEHDSKMLALQAEFAERRDKIRAEYHARVHELTGE